MHYIGEGSKAPMIQTSWYSRLLHQTRNTSPTTIRGPHKRSKGLLLTSLLILTICLSCTINACPTNLDLLCCRRADVSRVNLETYNYCRKKNVLREEKPVLDLLCCKKINTLRVCSRWPYPNPTADTEDQYTTGQSKDTTQRTTGESDLHQSHIKHCPPLTNPCRKKTNRARIQQNQISPCRTCSEINQDCIERNTVCIGADRGGVDKYGGCTETTRPTARRRTKKREKRASERTRESEHRGEIPLPCSSRL